MNDLALGFGVLARSTTECKTADPLTTVCFHQSDIGEYIRAEDTLFQTKQCFAFFISHSYIKEK